MGKNFFYTLWRLCLLELAKLELVSGNDVGRVSDAELAKDLPMALACQERPSALAHGRI